MASIIENIYNAASEDYDLGTLDTFKSDMGKADTRRRVYDTLKDDYDLGEWEQFSQTIDNDLGVHRPSVVPDALLDNTNRPLTFQEWRMRSAAQQAAKQNGEMTDEQVKAAFRNVNEAARRELEERRYKNGEDGKPKDSYIEDVGAGLMAGLGSVAQLPYKAIGAFEDWGSGLMQKATFNGFGGRVNFATNGNGIARHFFNECLGGNYFKERTKHYQKESDRYQDDKGMLDSVTEGDYMKALGKLGISTAQNAPNLGVSIVLSMMGMPELAASTLAGGAACDKWEEIQHDDALSDEDKAVAVLGTFLAEYVFEKIGDVRYQKMFQQGGTAQVRREVSRGARKAWQEFANSKFIKGAGNAWNKVMAIGGESITEMATDIAEQGIEIYLGNQDSIDWKQVGDAGIVALASDAPLQGAHYGIDTHHKRKLRAEIEGNETLKSAAEEQGKTAEQMADLLVRSGHGEELDQADYNALNNYIAATQNIALEKSEPSSQETENDVEHVEETQEVKEEAKAEAPEQKVESVKETARQVTVTIDGVEQQIAFSGAKVVYNEDGSIDQEKSSKIFLQDKDGNVIPGAQHDAMLSALNDGLRLEKQNGDQLLANDKPVVEEPVVEQPVVEQKPYPVLEDGTPDFAQMTPEQQVAYAMENGGEEAAAETIQTAIEELTAELDGIGKKKGLIPAQRVAEKNRIRQEIEAWKALEQPQESAPAQTDIRPVGVGDFGPIYDQFVDKPQEAIAFLMEKQDGECTGALSHPEIGPIDLVWGIEGTGGSDGYGLSKLIKFHPEVLNDLQGILNEMHVTQRSDNRIQMESERYKAGVRLTWNNESKTWLLTAFEKEEYKENSVLDKTTDTDETTKGGEGSDTALPQNTVSDDKGTTKNPDLQISKEKNAEKVDLTAENVVLMYNRNRSSYVFCRKEDDGTLVRLDTNKPLSQTHNGKDTAWIGIDKRTVRMGDKDYYILSTLNEKDLKTYSLKKGMINVMPTDGLNEEEVRISDLKWPDGTPVYKPSADRRDKQYSELRKNAKTLDDIADYVVLDYIKDGAKVNVTLRDLLGMLSRLNDDNERIYVGDKKYTGIIDKLISDMGKDENARADIEDILAGRVKEAAIVWNTLAEEGEKVGEGRTLRNKIRDFIEVLDKRGWAEKVDYFNGRTDAKPQEEAKPEQTPIANKRIATNEDMQALADLNFELREAKRAGDLEEVKILEQEIADLRSQIIELNVGNVEVNEEAGRRAIEYLKEKGVDIEEITPEEADRMIGEEKAEQLRNSDHTLYGIASNGKIYVISGRINPNTPVHEYTHLWARAFAKANPKKWADIVKVLKQTEQWQEVLNDADYASIKKSEDAVASEVLARLSGDYWGQINEDGKSKMDETFEKKALLARIRASLRAFWKQVGEWLGEKINLRQSDADAQLQMIIRKPIEDLIDINAKQTTQKETNFDKKFGEIRQTLDKGGDNVLSLQQISELTEILQDDIRQGNKPLVFERIPLEALQSGIGEQRTLAEALTIAALQSRRTSRSLERDGQEVTSEERASRDGSNTQMELDLMAYAKEKGIWYNDPIAQLTEQYGNSIGEGQESMVWADETTGNVVKAKSTSMYETAEEFLEGIVLNNWLFEDSKQTVTGFGYDKNGLFRIIYETPYIELEKAAELDRHEVADYMADFGFERLGNSWTEYTNGQFEVLDLHGKNIVKDSDGTIRCVDPIVKWVKGEHYTERTPEQEERDMKNEEALDALFDGDDMELNIGDPNPRNISQEVQDAMEKRKQSVQAKNENVHTKPAERLEGTAKLIYQLFDNTHGLYLLQKKINAWRKAHGKAPLPDNMDVRSLLNRCSSAIASRSTIFDQRQAKKLKEVSDSIAEKIAKSNLMQQFKQDLLEEEDAKGKKFRYEPTAKDLLERYLIARDNVERAELGIPTRGEREFTERMGVSMAEYAASFQDQLTDAELNELWDAVRGCTNTSLDELLRGERISQEDYDAYMQRKFYVPEKDFAEHETNEDLQEDENSAKKGGRSKQATAVAHKAEGGNSLATNILANIVHDAKNSIAVAQENLVRKAMFDLMEDNIDYAEEYGIPRPSQVWFVRTGTTDDGAPIYERRTERPSQDMFDETELVKTLIKQQQERLKNETDSEIRKQIRGAIESLRNELPIVSPKQAGDSNHLEDTRNDVPSVKVYVNGVQHEMTFDGMQEVADALNGVYDLRGSDATVRHANAVIASMFTTYNPTFFAVNLARDTPYIVAKGYSQYGLEFVGRFGKALGVDAVSTRKPIIQYLSGRLDESTPEGRMFYNFLMGGGNTGYSQLKGIREIKEDFEKSSFGKTKIGHVFDIGAKLNEYSELLTRFAAYKALIESGYSENEALNGAKNLSVNFNRRGAGQKFLNYFNSLSMFSNAAIQGATGFFRAFDNGKNASRAMFGLVFMPAFLGFMNTLLCPDDDDDEFVVSDFYRDNYCVIGAVKIPLPEQFRPFWTIGVNIAMGMQGRRNGGQIAKSLSQSFTQYLMPVPPAVSQALMKTEGALAGEDTGLGDAADVVSTLMLPQFASGVQEIAHNKDFMGNTIRKYDLGAIPQYKLGEKEAALYQDIAKFFYWANGGDTQVPLKYIKGSIDEEVGRWYVPLPANVNPKEVHKGLGTVIPAGWLNIICSIYGFGKEAITGDEDAGRIKDIPLVSTFYRPEDESMYRYTLYKEMKRIMTDYDSIKKEVVKQYAGGDKDDREAIEKEVLSKMKNATSRGFNPQYWEQLQEAYKATSVYDIAHKLGKTEDDLRKQYPELETLDDFQKLVGQLMNQELMEYHGIEHHIPWLQEKLGR